MAATPYERLQEAVDAMLRSGSNQVAAAEKLGVARQTLQRWLREAEKADVPGFDMIHQGGPAPAATLIRLQDEAARLRAEVKSIHRDNLTAEEVRESIFKLAAEPAQPPAWMVDAPKKSSGVTGVPMTIWSDWHLGEVVRRAEVNGVNEFNLEIAEARIKRLVERTVDLSLHHMTAPKYPGIVVNLIGDIVSGDIHQELSETNEQEIFPVILWAVDRIAAALSALADNFGNVFVACAPGNHGRMTKKPQAKRYVYKNADWMIYCLLERHFKTIGDKRIQFQVPATGECLYSVYDQRYMAVHGDDLGVKGGDGIIGVIGPISRGEIKLRHSQAQMGRDFDTLLMGHYHNLLWLPRCIVNNCLKGFDEYSRRSRWTASTPSQALWFNHPKHGITYRMEVLLEGREKASDLPWISWEKAA